jgi:general secretion pathway protein J
MTLRRRGFTLVELLVALAIFAVVSVLSLRAVSAALDHRAHAEAEAHKWRDLARLFAVIESDLGAALETTPAGFRGHAAPDPLDGLWLVLARAGRDDDGEAAVAPRVVHYRIAQGTVVRSTHHHPDPASGGPPIHASRHPAQVRSLALRYMNERGEWLSEWNASQTELPRALELDVVLAGNERVRRVLLVR